MPLTDLEIAIGLLDALRDDELTLHYQPIVDLNTGYPVGVEALLRWHHPSHGQVSPAEFIPVAERHGLISEIGLWVLDAACVQGKAWHDEFATSPPLVVSVNVSPVQMQSKTFADDVERVLQKTGFPASFLELEITEANLVVDGATFLSNLEHLQRMQVQIAIDDFGTGYASFARVKKVPVQVLKIDQSFVSGLPNSEIDDAIVESILQFAKIRRLTVTAEGVETEAQARYLRERKCARAQGYFFSRPVPPDMISQLLAAKIPLAL